MNSSPKTFSRAGLISLAGLLFAAITFLCVQAAYATGTPSPVSSMFASASGNGVINVQWINPSVDYDHTEVSLAPGTQTYSATSSLASFSGLISGQTYTFTAVVFSPDPAFYSTPTVVTATATGNTVPGAVTGVTGTAGDGSVTLSWSAPAANGGSAITSYTATLNAGQTCTTAATTCVISGLTNGTAYSATVTSTNTTGASASSTASASLTPIAQSAPLATTGVPLLLGVVIASASAILGLCLILFRRTRTK